ncbi:MAG: Flp pilus assembly protein CpaB [Elusimicrobiota bacterium]
MKLNYKNKNLLLGIFLAMGAMSLSYRYLSKTESSLKQNLKSQKVFVAKKDLEVGQIVIPDMIEEKEVFISNHDYQRLSSIEDLKNKIGDWRYRVGIPLLKGEIIYLKKLKGGASDLGLAWNLEEGFIAMTFRCSREASLAGLLKPGDLIHLIWTFEDKAVPMLSNVSVLAVDQEVWGGGKTKNHSAEYFEKENYYVTVMAPLEKGPRLALAQSIGNVTILLASPIEKDQGHLNSVSVKNIIQGI